MKTHRICKVCGKPVIKETKIKEYPFYCPHCYENRYRIETTNSKKIWRKKMEEEVVCMDLMSLYNHLNRGFDRATTKYGYEILREDSPYGSSYYDLVKEGGGVYRCCDGEEAIVLERKDGKVKLVSNAVDTEGDGDTYFFVLSEEEFDIATHQPIITGEE
jgi:hypothetical protein